MVTFKQFMIERKMSAPEAFKILGIDSSTTQDELKKVYRKLSIENHPDRGGDTDKMQDINNAYEVAKMHVGSPVGGVGKVDWDEIHEKYRVALREIVADFESKMNPDLFARYFESVFKKPISYKSVIRPTAKEIDKKYPPDSVVMHIEYSDVDNDTVIDMRITGSARNLVHPPKSLSGSAEQSYGLYTDITIFHNNKKNKLKRSDWNSTTNHKIFTDPEVLFPLKKMQTVALATKAKNAKFTRKDSLLYVTRKLKARKFNDFYIYDISDESGVKLSREVFMRKPYWAITGMFNTSNKFTIKLDMKNKFDPTSIIIPETEQAFVTLNDALNKLKKSGDIKKFQSTLKALKDG